MKRSPRRKLLNDYARQLMRRYPSMKEDIQKRLQHLNLYWTQIERVVTSQHGCGEAGSMIKGKFMKITCILFAISIFIFRIIIECLF